MVKSAAVFLLFLIFSAGCISQTTQEGKEPIKIGFIGPLSGELASWGENQRSAIELGWGQIISRGGVNGRKVEVIYEDSQCDPAKGVLAAKKLIEVDKVIAIIGDTCSSSVLAIAPLAEQNKILLISPSAGSDKITQAGDYVFRVFITNRLYADSAGKMLRQEGKNSAAVLYINNDYGINLASGFENSFRQNGGTIVGSEGYNPDVKDFRTVLLKINNANPDVILLAGYYPDGARIVTQAEELSINREFFGGSDAYDDINFITLAGNTSEGFRFLSVPAGAGPNFETFAAAYRLKYNKEPPIYSDYAYDVLMILVQAMQHVGTEPPAIKNALYKIDHPGASNRIRFDENGDILDPKITIKIIENGKILPLK